MNNLLNNILYKRVVMKRCYEVLPDFPYAKIKIDILQYCSVEKLNTLTCVENTEFIGR